MKPKFAPDRTLMNRRQRGWIGIDLGARAIKIAQVERVGAGLHLVDAVAMQRGPRGADDNDDVAWRATEIRRRSRPRPEASRPHRRLLPFAGANIAAHRRIARGHTATTTLDDCQSIRSAHVDGGDRVGVRLLAARNERRRRRRSTKTRSPLGRRTNGGRCRTRSRTGAGLECRVLDGQPLAIARAVEMLQPQGITTTHGVLDWGYERATLSIVRDGAPVFTRELRRCGINRTTSALSQALGVSPDDAQQVLTQYGVPSATPQHRSSRRN